MGLLAVRGVDPVAIDRDPQIGHPRCVDGQLVIAIDQADARAVPASSILTPSRPASSSVSADCGRKCPVDAIDGGKAAAGAAHAIGATE